MFKTPEYGFAYGLSGSASFKTTNRHDSTTRTSMIQVIGFNTTRKVNLQSIDAVIFFPHENYILSAQATHNYFPDKFWGIGPNSPDTYNPERYTFELLNVRPHFKKKLARHTFVGFIYEFQNVYRLLYPDSGLFAASVFYGKSAYKVSGAGLSLSYDSRNSAFWPEKGIYMSTQVVSLNRKLLSDFDAIKWTGDLRLFQRLSRGHILAFQLYSYRTFGQTPLRDLAALGGPNNLRGFYQGRYRGTSMFSGIAEYRYNFFRKLSACFFAGAGTVYDNPVTISASTLKYSYGAGLRYAFLEKERLNVRLDYGYSNKYNNGFYFTVGECF